MGKQINKADIRVEVRPRSLGDCGLIHFFGFRERTEAQAIADCEEIAEQIRRHVDGLPSCRDRGVDVVWDNEEVCEYCGRAWTEGDSPHNGGCCKEDIKVLDAPEEA